MHFRTFSRILLWLGMAAPENTIVLKDSPKYIRKTVFGNVGQNDAHAYAFHNIFQKIALTNYANMGWSSGHLQTGYLVSSG